MKQVRETQARSRGVLTDAVPSIEPRKILNLTIGHGTRLLERTFAVTPKAVECPIGKRAGLIYQALQRLDQHMAPGTKRAAAKASARLQSGGKGHWTFSDGRIRSYQTRTGYQHIVMRFLRWCRNTYSLRQLAEVDARADELASIYLTQRREQGYSPWTLATERSALRLFFDTPTLAEQVSLPARRREAIRRSRIPVRHDANFQPANWQPLIQFLDATGLRRREVRELHVSDVLKRPDGRAEIHVRRGKGGKERWVPVLPGREQWVLPVIEGRAPEEKVFAHLPRLLDIHAHRRGYAQAFYQHLSGRPLPPAHGRLPAGSVDRQAVLSVSRALGHNRADVVLTHYLR